MQYRNNSKYTYLNSFGAMYGNSAVVSYLVNGAVDAYAVGPLMTGVNPPVTPANVVYSASPWGGADYPVQLVRPRDLLTLVPNLNPVNPLLSLTNHLYTN